MESNFGIFVFFALVTLSDVVPLVWYYADVNGNNNKNENYNLCDDREWCMHNDPVTVHIHRPSAESSANSYNKINCSLLKFNEKNRGMTYNEMCKEDKYDKGDCCMNYTIKEFARVDFWCDIMNI